MSNRLLITLTSLVLLAMAGLFAIRALPFLWPAPLSHFISAEEVRGIAIVHHKIPYTVNFQQQNQIIEILNNAVPIAPQKYPKEENKPDFDQIVIYRFGADTLVITPEIFVDEDLAFRVPDWNGNGLLMEISGGKLREILNRSHDP